MPISPQIDAFVAQIGGLGALVAALDGVQPILVTIGTNQLLVDPATMPEAYARGSDVIRGVAQSAIVDLRNAISATVLAQEQPAGPTGATGATGPTGGATGATGTVLLGATGIERATLPSGA
jgi:hypothetical protein